jgi:carbamoyl-phosphate synthase large subunit
MKGLGRSRLPTRPERTLVLGSGALQIGQGGEFDYSGSQALKDLREEGAYTVLINPNIGTVQTSHGMADATYFLPIEPYFVEKVLETERIDAILLGFGGQTALNCGLALDESGTLARHGVRVLGTPVSAIRFAEDRRLFSEKLSEIGLSIANSKAASTVDEAVDAAHAIGLPIVLRAAFSLGGKGSAIVNLEAELRPALERAFAGASQVLVEECLSGWKEIEYEIVRDASDNVITVCNMENVDPMGIHTGDSVVVAPSQTLNDHEYQSLRDVALRAARHLGIIGECNIQYAVNPETFEYRVIELNPRLSRSSALASKATGYPLAYVAAKIALGYTLPQLANAITRTTTAFFEPALDYIVCKVPRWDFDKFEGVGNAIDTEMKSVGEVMAIGRSFGEALQKALRMQDAGIQGLDPEAFSERTAGPSALQPSAVRLFAIARALHEGRSVEEVAQTTSIDRFFLIELRRIIDLDHKLRAARDAGLDAGLLRAAKRAGFSDQTIARHTGGTEHEIRERRRVLGILPRLAQIDTLAAEYPAKTNYLYLTYGAAADDVAPLDGKKVLILGSGCYRIGSSVEFDWCCVSAATEARLAGYETVLLNCNPETVSTDYDVSDRLVFDEVSLETVLELCARERPHGVIVSMGGQTPNSLALRLHEEGVNVLGTSPLSIDRAEDRQNFSALCDELRIDQPRWAQADALDDLEVMVKHLGGFPVLVRPSYVLSGAAMRIAHSQADLRSYLARATEVSSDHPVVISKFERNARELEFDAVADQGEIVYWAVSEHVENAGVHSGDATLVLPPQQVYIESVRGIRAIGAKLARALNVSGPFNVQVLSRHTEVKVIECNLRASRTFRFVSKVLGTNFATEATRIILDAPRSPSDPTWNPRDRPYVAVKAPQFSFRRMAGADPVVGVEMASTGEVACFGDDADEALLKAMLGTGFRFPVRGVLLSLGPVAQKYWFTEEARALISLGLPLYATVGTAEILRAEGVPCEIVGKDEGHDKDFPSSIARLENGTIDLVINIPREYDQRGRPDGYRIRRAAVDLEIPLITDLSLARRIVRALCHHNRDSLQVRPWSHYMIPREKLPRRA